MNTIPVVIPCHPKDKDVTLEACIASVRNHIPEAGTIYVVSKERYTSSAEWISQDDMYPFRLEDVEANLPPSDGCARWYHMQLLKLYAPVYPRFLEVDCDIVFQRRTPMLAEDGTALYATGTEHHRPYFEHMARLLPGLRRMQPVSGIVHHQIMERRVLSALFGEVERLHGEPCWMAYLHAVDPAWVCKSGAADTEVYFNYMLWRFPERGIIRPLPYADLPRLETRPDLAFVGYHSWMRAS